MYFLTGRYNNLSILIAELKVRNVSYKHLT